MISQVLWGDKTLGYVGDTCNFEGAYIAEIQQEAQNLPGLVGGMLY